MSWNCITCTFLNKSACTRCSMCHTDCHLSTQARPSPLEIEQDKESTSPAPLPTAPPTTGSNESKDESDSCEQKREESINLLVPPPTNNEIVMHHPAGFSQFTVQLTNACALLAIEIVCLSLTQKTLSWKDIDRVLRTAKNPSKNAQVSDEIDKGALRERVDILTEVFPGTGYKGCTNGTMNDIRCALEANAEPNRIGPLRAVIVTTGGATFTAVRVNEHYLVIDTHSFEGKGI